MTINPKLLSTDQVAELIGVKPPTVHDLVKAGKIPQPIKFSARTYRWRASDLETAFQEKLS